MKFIIIIMGIFLLIISTIYASILYRDDLKYASGIITCLNVVLFIGLVLLLFGYEITIVIK